MKRITEHAAAAKQIRGALKELGIKASVRSESYAGGTSIRVFVKDLAPSLVAKVKSLISRYEYGSFDGMTDSYHYDNRHDDIPQVKYAFVVEEFSEEIKAAAESYARSYYADDPDWPASRNMWPILNGTEGDFWDSRDSAA